MIWLALALAPVAAAAQATATGGIVGLVTDSSGAVIPGATITLTDRDTGTVRTTQTNATGRYVFPVVNLGSYDLTADKTGFQQQQVENQSVSVGAQLTENFQLQVGTVTQTINVSPTAVAELQTMNASMGSEISGPTALALPNLGRDASSLLIFQPTANPGGNNNSFYTGFLGGEIAGAQRDQNTFMLDGGNNTSDIDGSGDIYTSGFSANSSGSGVVPTPVESIQAVRLVANNPTADFNLAGGGEIMMVTKRGTSQWHGAAYDYYRANWLDANSWSDNRRGLKQQKSHQNRFGVALGGPLLPPTLGGKTFFFVNYEGRRFPQSQTLTEIVPSALMRQGILQFRDATGTINQYDLATSTACGPAGGLPCDPRHIGISPAVQALWNKYMPPANNAATTGGGVDGLNTLANVQQLSTPLTDDSLAFRMDHDFGANWHWMSSYRYYHEAPPYTGYFGQVDWGGVLPGDTLGKPGLTSYHPVQPRYFVTALTGQITPNLTNQFHFNYVRNWWAWTTAGAPQLVPNAPAAINIGGYPADGARINPILSSWPAARQRTWNGHNWNYSDDLSWAHGNHLVQFGGNFYHDWIHFLYDDGGGAITSPIYTLGYSDGVATSNLYRPPTCTATLQTGCISSASAWDSLYYEMLGALDTASALATRTGPNFKLLPAGTPSAATTTVDTFSLYASDSWHLTPDLTFTYGVNWGVEMPPKEINGAQDVLVDANGNPITTTAYLTTKMNDALAGKNYNPVLGYAPVSAIKSLGGYPFKPYYGGFSPRLALAWNPHFGDTGLLHALFGADRTVLRGGWARINDRANGTQTVVTPAHGMGVTQALTCTGANSATATGNPASCNGYGSQTAATVWRLGVDGTVAPLPTAAPTLTTPIYPGVNSSRAGTGDTFSPNFRPADSDQFNLSLQRQFAGNTILEVGWVGSWTHHLYRRIDLNNVPYMMTLGGQSFAQAYAGLAKQILANPNIAPNSVTTQPFFEAALATGPGNYCAGYTSCTAAVAANEGTAGKANINLSQVASLWTDLESHWVFGPALLANQGLAGAELETSNGHSSYNAMVISLKKRASAGLTLDANFTWSHSLDQGNYYQASGGSQTVNPYSNKADYGNSLFDLRYIGNIMAVYNLPFSATGAGWQNHLLGGWSIAPILTWHSGDPLMVNTGSWQEFGEPGVNSVNDVSAVATKPIPSPGTHFGVAGSGGIGTVNAAGINAFANPAAVFASLRPGILGVDGSRSTVIGYGPGFWNLDLNLRKDFQVGENLGATVNVEMINAFNHVNWQDPSLSLQSATDFGAITGVKNNPRVIELGLRLHW